MLRAARFESFGIAARVSLALSVGDLEGLHPTSDRFSRFPLRGSVLAASLAWRGDSVTGVNENYTTPTRLSTPCKNYLSRPSKPVKTGFQQLINRIPTEKNHDVIMIVTGLLHS
jgi:hypothetical protein